MIENLFLINNPIAEQAIHLRNVLSEDAIPLSNKLQQVALAVDSSPTTFNHTGINYSYIEPFVQDFIIAITNLSPKEDVNDYANDIYKIILAISTPENRKPAITKPEQQMALLQQPLEIIDKSSVLYEPLMVLFVEHYVLTIRNGKTDV
ncbi:hypothetical protein [Citrobacter sp. wls826]|uniref:hypothetical protein n=1 Tax=Citrobacter sp. wls826 TaxID=2576415 RepID=UPI0010C93AE7|nr:hypothetical protein [Citrobacter sp. wls826]TKU21990.1 hypothetical protein FDW87_08450 [Citrobacter sp. wls826]TKV30119.1 hypothetical protein FDX20_27260 [Citrobacter sp. TBCS-11]